MHQTVAVTGASGFVGREVVRALRSRGARVVALSRDPSGTDFPPDVEVRSFDPNAPWPDPAAFQGADAVVHLAGESVAGRWTPAKKRRIVDSRVAGTALVAASLKRLQPPPEVLVSSSAVGYYGDRGDEVLTEQSLPGSGFLADVCTGWEAAAREFEAFGVRTVQMRTGIALGAGGALAQMQAPFRLGVGGPLGSGRQFVPWIHVRDLAELYCFAIENAAVTGPINAVAPDYATNARLTRGIGTALKRPALLPAPPFALRTVLGEFANSLLESQLVLPAVAQSLGFAWSYPTLETALSEIFGSASATLGVRRFQATQFVARPLEEAFAFFSDPRNLRALTPPSLNLTITGAPEWIARGSIIDYTLRVHGVPMRWKTLIAEYEPMKRFVDVQLRGPYALWRHTHDFRPVEGGVEISDTVDYLLPFAPFGDLAAPAIARDIAGIFRFRHDAIAERFGGSAPFAEGSFVPVPPGVLR